MSRSQEAVKLRVAGVKFMPNQRTSVNGRQSAFYAALLSKLIGNAVTREDRLDLSAKLIPAALHIELKVVVPKETMVIHLDWLTDALPAELNQVKDVQS